MYFLTRKAKLEKTGWTDRQTDTRHDNRDKRWRTRQTDNRQTTDGQTDNGWTDR